MIGLLRKLMNLLLAIIKWPLALFLVYLFPDTLLVMLELLEKTANQSEQIGPFICGFVGYTLAWMILFKRLFMGSWLSTLEHELTHGFFALLTLHKIVEIKTSYVSGGHIKYEGDGNWLITLSPYFFPTLSFLIMGVLAAVDSAVHPWLNLSLGISVAYHITSTWRETHWGQSDIKEVGFIYSFLFLPSANIISYAAILAFILGGTDEVLTSFSFLAEALVWPI